MTVNLRLEIFLNINKALNDEEDEINENDNSNRKN